MGVPAFYKWLVTKYPKVVVDCIEERAGWAEDGASIPVDTSSDQTENTTLGSY